MGYQKHVLIILISLVLTRIISGSEAPGSIVIASHCTSECGGIAIPYPFGIGEGCYYKEKDDLSLKPSMSITCNHTFNPPKPILGNNIQILNISLKEAEIHLNNNISFKCDKSDNSSYHLYSWINLRTFTISSSKNKFVATGCDTYAWFKGKRYGKNYSTGCMTTCNELNDVANDGRCNGVGCCQASIPDGVTNLQTKSYSYNHHTGVEFNPCSVAYPVANDAFKFSKQNLTQNLSYYLNERPKFPVVYNWGIGTKNCSEAEKEGSRLCKNNTECINLTHEQQGLDGYRCDCKEGYSGNPYLPQGCQDTNECEAGSDECEKPEYCRNDIGGYHCECPNGYHGIGTTTDRCISNTKTKPWHMPVIVTAGTGGAIIILLIMAFIAYWRHEERKNTALREKNFLNNGGEILRKKNVSGMDVLKIFTIQELENATDKYSKANMIGEGGFGVVYKGVVSDNQTVAIKVSLKVNPNQVEQFINEVLILSQINNRHVVKLLGCCLETEVPLLVYEFINNGTLFDHLHDEEKASCFTWNLRLKIAMEIADVLSYLHTTISTPIVHRDMKSMNVLLDKSYTAKVADFGASKLIPLDQRQLEAMVVGTQGYLDPEYMQNYELTEKSDVYSFGVVLLELLTKENALSYDKSEAERCLAKYFLHKMKEDRLFDIVDKNITDDPKQVAQIKEVANLAKWCLKLKGDDRPTMKEAAMELERIKRMGSQPKFKAEKSFDQPENSDHSLGIAMDDES